MNRLNRHTETLIKIMTVFARVAFLSWLLCVSPAMAQGNAAAQIFVVQPSTKVDPLLKAQEDWAAINSALQNAGPGATVRLEAGTFYLHKTIVRRDFQGTLKGAGKDRTTVRTAPGITFDLTDNLTYSFVDGFSFKDHFMFSFPHQLNNEKRSVTVSDMKFICDQPATPWSRGFPGSPSEETNLNAVAAVVTFNESLPKEEIIDLNVSYLRLDIEGVEDASFRSPRGNNLSCATGVSTLGVARGRVIARHINVENAVSGAVFGAWVGEGSSVTVSNSMFVNNFVGVLGDGWTAFYATQNEFINGKRLGIFLQNIPTFVPTGFTSTGAFIWNNSFSDGRVFDIFLALSQNVRVYNNEFKGLTTVGPQAGGAGSTSSIFTFRVSDSHISNNSFTNIMGGVGPNILLALSDKNIVNGNSHGDSGQPGWTGDPINGLCLDGPGAIRVQGGNDNLVADNEFPDDTTVNTMVCDQGDGTIITIDN